MQQLFTIHFLENNLAMAKLHFWQSTFSGWRAFSFICVPQNLNNYFRGSSLKRRLKKTVLKCENFYPRTLYAGKFNIILV
jgi:hypothetical protein